jgi:hypothetical protein
MLMKVRLPGVAWAAAAALVAALLLGLTGCGSGRGTVSGKVSYRGKPLATGSVVFVGPDKTPITAEIGTDGTYTATGVLEGSNRVAVVSYDPATLVPTDKAGRPTEAPPVDPKLWFPIPGQYEDANTSGLVYPVTRNTTNTIDIDLQ